VVQRNALPDKLVQVSYLGPEIANETPAVLAAVKGERVLSNGR